MKAKDLAPLLLNAGHMVEDTTPLKGFTIHILLYEGQSEMLTSQAIHKDTWGQALDLWVSLEPEDLPKHIALHPVLDTETPGWSESEIHDDIVTYAAQAYLIGLALP